MSPPDFIPPFAALPLEGDGSALFASLPARRGVGQLLGEGGRSLVIGRPASLRRWAASHLGASPPPKRGKRPRTDLRSVTREVRYALSPSAFHQLLLFERLMALHVAVSARPDLSPPAFLHLDPAERFPRISAGFPDGPPDHAFGPFRNRKSAARAADEITKRYRLRPCDFTFEPDPELPLGLRCVYAQVGSCAAPCLERVTADAYREIAASAESFLSRPEARGAEPAAIPPWVARATTRALVVEPNAHGAEVYPVVRGSVLDSEALAVTWDGLESGLAGLSWRLTPGALDDRAWLLPWLAARKRTGRYVVLDESDGAGQAASRIRAVIGAPR